MTQMYVGLRAPTAWLTEHHTGQTSGLCSRPSPTDKPNQCDTTRHRLLACRRSVINKQSCGANLHITDRRPAYISDSP